MKYLAFIAILMASPIFGQQTLHDFVYAKNPKTYWLGIDFSNVKLIGVDMNVKDAGGNTGVLAFRNRYFKEINELVLLEPKKYDVKSAFKLKEIENDIKAVNAVNKTASIDNMEAKSAVEITTNELSEIVKSYSFGKEEGYGIMMLAEVLDKNKQVGIFHIILMDLENNTLIKAERFSGPVGGFGVRNYYARSVYEIITEFKKKGYNKWVKEVEKK